MTNLNCKDAKLSDISKSQTVVLHDQILKRSSAIYMHCTRDCNVCWNSCDNTIFHPNDGRAPRPNKFKFLAKIFLLLHQWLLFVHFELLISFLIHIDWIIGNLAVLVKIFLILADMIRQSVINQSIRCFIQEMLVECEPP